MKKVDLTIYERVVLKSVENSSPAASKDAYRKSIKVLERLAFSEDEKLEHGIVEGRSGTTWEPSAETVNWGVEFENDELLLLIASSNKFALWPKDPRVGKLLDKMDGWQMATVKDRGR